MKIQTDPLPKKPKTGLPTGDMIFSASPAFPLGSRREPASARYEFSRLACGRRVF
jgi:hypothetical protein